MVSSLGGLTHQRFPAYFARYSTQFVMAERDIHNVGLFNWIIFGTKITLKKEVRCAARVHERDSKSYTPTKQKNVHIMTNEICSMPLPLSLASIYGLFSTSLPASRSSISINALRSTFPFSVSGIVSIFRTMYGTS